MRKGAAAHLSGVVRTLEHDIEITAAYGLDGTVTLLRAARLDLLTRIHGISETELAALSDAISLRRPVRSRPTRGSEPRHSARSDRKYKHLESRLFQKI